MTVMCNLIHHVEFEPNISVSALSHFAIVTDKYDTMIASKLAGKAWLDLICSHIRLVSMASIAEVFTVAYSFDDYSNFKKLSATLLAHPEGIKAMEKVALDGIGLPGCVLGKCLSTVSL